MKKWMFRIACLLAFAFSPAVFIAPPAQAVVATTKVTLTTSAWTDLGVGPILVSAAGRVIFAVADTTPSLVSEGLSIAPGSSFTFNTASHVWAMSLDGISAFVYVSPILASGGSGGGGAITAGTTLTTGFAAGQLIMSDGTKAQAASASFTDTSFSVQVPGAPAYVNRIDLQSNGSNFEMFFNNYGGHFNFVESRLTPPTRVRFFNTMTDMGNGEWGAFDWGTTPNVLTIGAQANGTGTVRPINFVGSNLQVGGVAAVSCTTGTVSAATMVVTKGIVTHC